jgi:peptide/nickel transport system substrate-binding protein
MIRRRFGRWMALFALLTLLISACSGAGSQTGGTQTGGTTGASTPKTSDAPKKLVIAQTGDARNLDANVAIDGFSMNIYVNIFDSLFKRDANMQPKPHLATSAKALNDTTWEVKLRSGVKFQNGEPLNAEAVKFTIARIFDKKTKSVLPTWLKGIKEAKVIDDLTVHIITEGPMPLMLQNLVMIYPVPPKYVKEVGNEKFNQNPIGTGPFKLKSWTRDDRAVLEANSEYWGGKPAYQEITFRFIPEGEQRVSALLAGEVDIIQDVPPASKDRVKGAVEIRSVPTGRIFLLQLAASEKHKFLEDQKVRQAIAHAIDTDAIIKHVTLGTGVKLATFLNPTNFGHNPNLKPYEYNPAKAKELLAQAGYGDGFDFVINTTPDRKDIAEAVAGELKKVGIRAKVATHESGAFLKGWREHKLGGHGFILGLLSQTWDADGLLYLRFKCGEPMSYFCDPRADKDVKDARFMIDIPKREKLYQDLMAHLHGQMPIVPLFGSTALYGVKANLNWKPRTDELTYLFEAKPK